MQNTRAPRGTWDRHFESCDRSAESIRACGSRHELALWSHLRDGNAGTEFVWQQPVYGWRPNGGGRVIVVDFYAPAIGLRIELDAKGKIGRRTQDVTDLLEAWGVRTIRINNNAVRGGRRCHDTLCRIREIVRAMKADSPALDLAGLWRELRGLDDPRYQEDHHLHEPTPQQTQAGIHGVLVGL